MEEIYVVINGQDKQINSTKLTGLFQQMQIDTRYLAIAINNKVIPSAECPDTILKTGDQIEMIRPVCGG